MTQALAAKAYSPADVANILGMSRKTVYELIRSGHIPATKIGPRRIIIPRKQFDDWLTNRIADSQTETGKGQSG